MSLLSECPRCPTTLGSTPGGGYLCPEHGPTPPLRRPTEASYGGFTEALVAAGDFPTYLPWPMSPGWSR